MPEIITPTSEVQVDFIQNGKGSGPVANQLLASGFNVNSLRTNATLRKDEWKQYDKVVVEIARNRLNGVADLMSRGLKYEIPNGMGSTVLEYEDISDMTDAELTMDGQTRERNDRLEFDIKYLPLPIVHKDFQINARVLASSRTNGRPLDTTQASVAARKVAEKVETMLFQGASSYAFGGGIVYGYQDAPNRNTVSLSVDWDASAITGELILADVIAMKAASIAAKHFGPWVLYIPTAYETVMDDDFKAATGKTLRQRLLEIGGIQDIKVSDYLTANNVMLVEMQSDVIRMVEGMPITTVQWQTEGNMIYHFKVMTILVPQVRADQGGNSGITHLS